MSHLDPTSIGPIALLFPLTEETMRPCRRFVLYDSAKSSLRTGQRIAPRIADFYVPNLVVDRRVMTAPRPYTKNSPATILTDSDTRQEPTLEGDKGFIPGSCPLNLCLSDNRKRSKDDYRSPKNIF